MNEIQSDADVVVDHPLSHLATWMGIPFFLFSVGVFAWLPPGDEFKKLGFRTPLQHTGITPKPQT